MRSRDTLAIIEAIQISFTFASHEITVSTCQKGNIFCYLKAENTTKTPNKSEEATDVTTDTEEN